MTEHPPATGFTRRSVLGLVGVGAAGVVVGAGGASLVSSPTAKVVEENPHLRAYSPYGQHQSGIVTPAPPATQVVALDLTNPSRDGLGRLLRVWSDDIVRLMRGEVVAGDPAPHLSQARTSLTITVGVGPRVFTLPGLTERAPSGFVDVPAMRHDKLQPRWSGGDVCLLVQAADNTSVDHAVECLLRDAEPFARLRWLQQASWRGIDTDGRPTTGRNLFGQVDGSGNPKGRDLDDAVWSKDPGFSGGTQLVVRRIEMNLPTWNKLTANEQEQALGRDFAKGAPLSGGGEFDAPDFTAKDEQGRLKIPANSHVARSHPSNNGGRMMLRRGMNYTHTDVVDGRPVRSTGLVFMSFQASIAHQFTPVQRKLDELDELNTWTTAIGSAAFAILPGFSEGGFLGKGLVS